MQPFFYFSSTAVDSDEKSNPDGEARGSVACFFRVPQRDVTQLAHGKRQEKVFTASRDNDGGCSWLNAKGLPISIKEHDYMDAGRNRIMPGWAGMAGGGGKTIGVFAL